MPEIEELAPDAAVAELLVACGLEPSDLADHPDTLVLGRRRGDAVDAVVAVEHHGSTGLLRSLAVAPGQRGRGLARELVQAAEHRAAADGLAALYLLTETAAEFFLRLGYTRLAREAVPPRLRATPQFTRLCPASATCLGKTLPGSQRATPS
jgi:amino-acid N-acetyltransferase